MTARYLISETNGRVFIWTPRLHARKDMRIATEAEARSALAALAADAQARADTEASEDGGNDEVPLVPAGELTMDDILAMTDKLKLKEAATLRGVDLDMRKSVKALQSDLIEALGMTQE